MAQRKLAPAEGIEEVDMEVEGHGKKLMAFPSGRCKCGNIVDGIVFRFGNEGNWVVSLAALEALCAKTRENIQSGKSM